MAEEFVGFVDVIAELQDRITQLKKYLLEVTDMSLNKYSTKLVDEVTMFTETLDTNLQFLTTNLPPPVSRKAFGSLMNELEEANTFMADALEQKKFKSSWSRKEAKSKLESRRQKLVSAFQLAFIITFLNVAFDGDRKSNDFQERLQELYSVHTSDQAGTRTQIHELLQPLVSRIRGQDEKLKSLVRFVEDGVGQSNATESTDVQKFFADFLAAVDQLQNEYHLEELMYDPLYPDNLMWDPVKASDGFTYDRWTIVEHDDHPDPEHRSIPDGKSPYTRAPLLILCDDVTVRQRLYNVEKYRIENAERKSAEMREKYRTQTLELVKEEHYGEALERLEHVLKWAPEDEVCRKHREVICQRLGKSESLTKSVDERLLLRVTEDLRGQSQQYELKLRLLEKENMDVKTRLSAAENEAEAKVSSIEEELGSLTAELEVKLRLLEKENMDVNARLSAMENEAEAKLSSVEEERERLTGELEVKLQLLKKENMDVKARLSATENEAEMKVSLVEEELGRLTAELEVKFRLLEKENMDVNVRLSVTENEAEAKLSSVKEELGRLTVALDGLKYKTKLDAERNALLEGAIETISIEGEKLALDIQQYEVKLRHLEKENMDLKARLSATENEAEAKLSSVEEELGRLIAELEMKLQLLEKENMDVIVRLSTTENEAEAKVSSVEEELGRLTAVLDGLRYRTKLDAESIQEYRVKLRLLEKENIDVKARLVATENEAEGKLSSMEELGRLTAELDRLRYEMERNALLERAREASTAHNISERNYHVGSVPRQEYRPYRSTG